MKIIYLIVLILESVLALSYYETETAIKMILFTVIALAVNIIFDKLNKRKTS